MAVTQAQITVPSNGTQAVLFSLGSVNSAQLNIRNTGTVTVLLGPQAFLNPPLSFLAVPVVGGGTFSSGTYYWQITALNGLGETMASNEASATIAASGQASLSWTIVTGATSYKIYRANSSGGEAISPALVTTIGSGATSGYSDTGTAAATGHTPVANTAVIPALFPLNAGEYIGTPAIPDDTLVAQVQTPGTAGQVTLLGLGHA